MASHYFPLRSLSWACPPIEAPFRHQKPRFTVEVPHRVAVPLPLLKTVKTFPAFHFKMPLLRLQTKSGNVDDGVTLVDLPGSEPLTFTSRRLPTLDGSTTLPNRPKPFYHPGVSRAAEIDVAAREREQRDIWSSPEPEIPVSDMQEVQELPEQEQESTVDLPTSNSAVAIRGILKFAPAAGRRSSVQRRVNFPDGTRPGDTCTNAPSTPLHPSIVDESRVKIEDESPFELARIIELASNDGDAVLIKTETERYVFSEDSIPGEVIGDQQSDGPPSQEVLSKLSSHRKARMKAHQKWLRSYLRSPHKGKCCTSTSQVRVLYGRKRHLLLRDCRSSTATSPSVKKRMPKRSSLKTPRGCCAAACAAKCLFVKLLEKRQPGIAGATVRRLVPAVEPSRMGRRARAVSSQEGVTAPAVPSIVITAAVEAESPIPETPFRSPATPGWSVTRPRIETVYDLLRYTKGMLQKGDAAFKFPPYELLKCLRALAHHLLQGSQSLSEQSYGLQD